MIINMNGAKAPETPSPVLQEKTVTPQTLPTVIGADEGYTGLSQVTVNPDTNLKAENIRSGKTIFGVDGTFVGEPVYTDALDYNLVGDKYYAASSADIMASSGCNWILNPDALTELDFTAQRNYGFNMFIGVKYSNGGVTILRDPFKVYTTTYLPSQSNYNYYKFNGNFSGDTKFYMDEYLCRILQWDAENHPTHMKGVVYVYMSVALSGSGYTDYEFDPNANVECVQNYDGAFYELEVDTDCSIEYIRNKHIVTFHLNLPEITGSVTATAYNSQNPKGGNAVIAVTPKKVVFS